MKESYIKLPNITVSKLQDVVDHLDENNIEYIEEYKRDEEINRLNNIIDTILNFGIFTTMCPMELYFDEEKKENESKAQDTFFKDEYCENCKDDYKKCWLKYFKELNELKGDNK